MIALALLAMKTACDALTVASELTTIVNFSLIVPRESLKNDAVEHEPVTNKLPENVPDVFANAALALAKEALDVLYTIAVFYSVVNFEFANS